MLVNGTAAHLIVTPVTVQFTLPFGVKSPQVLASTFINGDGEVGNTPNEHVPPLGNADGSLPASPTNNAPLYRDDELAERFATTSTVMFSPAMQLAIGLPPCVKLRIAVKSFDVQFRADPKRVEAHVWPVMATVLTCAVATGANMPKNIAPNNSRKRFREYSAPPLAILVPGLMAQPRLNQAARAWHLRTAYGTPQIEANEPAPSWFARRAKTHVASAGLSPNTAKLRQLNLSLRPA